MAAITTAGQGLASRQLNRLLEEAARLAEQDQAPVGFHSELLKWVLAGTGANSAVIWTCSDDRKKLSPIWSSEKPAGLEAGRSMHDALLGQALQLAQPISLPAEARLTDTNEQAGNPTPWALHIVPILLDRLAVGLIEVWLEPSAQPSAECMQFLVGMAHYASVYIRNRKLRLLAGQQQIWSRLETFVFQVQNSLNLSEVACIVANDGRRLIGCDRLTVGLRRGRHAVVEAVSGVEIIEQRSGQVRQLRELLAAVLRWGEKLIYAGTIDDSWPAPVLKALNTYLKESEARLLAVLPLRDERCARPQAALLLEHFGPDDDPLPIFNRLEVIGRHAAGALHNALIYRRVPLRGLWQLLGGMSERAGSRGWRTASLAAILVSGLIAVLCTVPWPLKLDATGQLLPMERRYVYAPVEGRVIRFEQGVQPGGCVVENQALVLLHNTELEQKLVQLRGDIAGAQEEAAALARQAATARTEPERLGLWAQKKQKELVRDRKQAELNALRVRAHADDARPGCFWLNAPIQGVILSNDFRETLVNRTVKPSEPLLRIGDRDRPWEVELRIPTRYLSQVLDAFPAGDPQAELDVDVLLSSAPARVFRAKLPRSQLCVDAQPDLAAQESEPTVHAQLRLDGHDIAESERVPKQLLVAGTEVHARIRCGEHALGWSLFHGVWEFVCEKWFGWV